MTKKQKAQSKAENAIYREGQKAWRRNKRIKDCPYKQGTNKFQIWVNGWGDESDKAFLKVVKKYPSLLVDS